MPNVKMTLRKTSNFDSFVAKNSEAISIHVEKASCKRVWARLSEMAVCQIGDFASSWCTLYETFFYEIWFIYLLDCPGVFTKGCRYG